LYYNIQRLINKVGKRIPRLRGGTKLDSIPKKHWDKFHQFSNDYRQEILEQQLGLVEAVPEEEEVQLPKPVDHVGRTKKWVPKKGHKEEVGMRLTKQLLMEKKVIEDHADEFKDNKAYADLIHKIWEKQQSRHGQKAKIG
jgi:hypothetical protein